MIESKLAAVKKRRSTGQLEENSQENVGAALDVGGSRVLRDVVADPAGAGDEYHPRRAAGGERLCVVPGSARHAARARRERAGLAFHEPDHRVIELDRLKAG